MIATLQQGQAGRTRLWDRYWANQPIGSRWTLDDTKKIASYDNTAGLSACSVMSAKVHSDKRYFEVYQAVPKSFAEYLGILPINPSRSGSLAPLNEVGISGLHYRNIDGWISYAGDNVTTYPPGTIAALWDVGTPTVMMAIDFPAGKVWFGLNGTWYNSGNPGAGTNATWDSYPKREGHVAFTVDVGSTQTAQIVGHFTAADCSYTPPTGFPCWDE